MGRNQKKPKTESKDDSNCFAVEKILDKRFIDERVEYYVKWKSYPNQSNTWEPIDHLLECKKLIQEYESNKLFINNSIEDSDDTEVEYEDEVEDQIEDEIQSDVSTVEPSSDLSNDSKRGFDKGLTPEKIMAATLDNNEIMFLIKWKEEENGDIVSAKEANIRCPQLVIQFYEKRISFQH
jgi:hypothetical protein